MKLQTFVHTKFTILSFVLLTLIATFGIEADDSSTSNVIFSTGFEAKQYLGWKKEICKLCSHAFNIVNSHSRSGLHSARFELHRSDLDSISGSKRSELAREIEESGKDRERWYGVSIFLPNNYDYDPEPEIVTQWHATPDKNATGRIEDWRSPPLALLTVKGKWQIDWRWDKNKVTQGEPKSIHKRLGAYTRGVWTDWVFHVKWSYADKGKLEVWKNGQKVLSHIGPIGYNDNQGAYMKVGIYKWVWNENKKSESTTFRRVIYVDDVYSSGVDLTDKVQ